MERYDPEVPFPGAVVARATLRQLLDNKSLIIHLADRVLTYNDLVVREQIDETSIALHIGTLFRHSSQIYVLDLQGKYDLEEHYESIPPDEQGGVIIEPGDFFLGRTLERVTTPKTLVGRIEERRTAAGSLGLTIKGFIPPGLEAEQIRLTIANSGRLPVKLYVGKVPPMKVLFQPLSSSETYRKDRQARVSKGQLYSSGAGNATAIQPGAVFASLNFNQIVKAMQQLTVSFRLDNASTVPIHSVKICSSQRHGEI